MLDLHKKPIAERIDWLFGLAHEHSQVFRSSDAWLARQHYLARHPTAIIVLKCMDGRLNLPFATHTPAGILMPFRNLGGMFDLGWPHLGEVLAHHVLRMTNTGRRVLILITYHWSKGDPERGCAGFNYDTSAAITHTHEIRRQVEQIFGSSHNTVYPLVCGFETDEDALVIHGLHETTLNLATLSPRDAERLEPELSAILPDMPAQMRGDLLPLLLGNLEHIALIREQMRQHQRQLSIEHHEWAICLGRGFDFLHIPNIALIIGPYSPDLADPLRKAASIIENNMQTGRIPDDGFLLLASVPYDEIGVDRARAELKAYFLASFAAKVLQKEFSTLAAKMTKRAAVLDWHSRILEEIEV